MEKDLKVIHFRQHDGSLRDPEVVFSTIEQAQRDGWRLRDLGISAVDAFTMEREIPKPKRDPEVEEARLCQRGIAERVRQGRPG